MKEQKNSQEFLDPDSDLVKAMDRALAQKNPKLAALCRQGVQEHQEAVKAGRWKPLR